MTRPHFGVLLMLLLSQNYTVSARADEACYTASKTYRIHPLRGGPDLTKGWSVKGETFRQCAQRSERTDRRLRARYPGTTYKLSLAATIGCHTPCSN